MNTQQFIVRKETNGRILLKVEREGEMSLDDREFSLLIAAMQWLVTTGENTALITSITVPDAPL